MQTDRRRWTRLQPEMDTVEVRFSGATKTALVHDLSFGGGSFELPTMEVEEGTPIEVLWNGAWMKGTIANVMPDDEGCRIGVRWKSARQQAT